MCHFERILLRSWSKITARVKKELWYLVSRNPLHNDINKIWLTVRTYPDIKILILYPNGQQTMVCGANPTSGLVLYSCMLNMVLTCLQFNKEENATETDMAWNIYYVAFYRKSLLIPALYKINWDILMGIKKDNTIRSVPSAVLISKMNHFCSNMYISKT